MRLKPPYLGNTHVPSDEVGKSQRAIIRGKLFFVDEDEAVVLHTVPVSSVTIRRTDRKHGESTISSCLEPFLARNQIEPLDLYLTGALPIPVGEPDMHLARSSHNREF